MRRLVVLLAALALLSCHPQPINSSPSGHWVSVNQGLATHAPVLSIAAGAFDQVYAAAYDRVGVYKSSGSLTEWTADNQGLPALPSFSLLSDGKTLWAATAAGLYGRPLTSDVWRRAASVPGVAVYALNRASASLIYLGTDAHGVFSSGDGGVTWGRLPGLDGEIILSVLGLDSRTILAGTSGHGLYITHDEGGTWAPVAAFRDAYVPLLMQDSREPSTIYAGTRRALMRSRDAGSSWQIVEGGIEKEQVYTLLVSPDGKNLLAGTASHGILMSEDDGETWQQQGVSRSQGDLAPAPVPEGHAVLSMAAEGSTVLAGTTDGVIHSVDQGLAWSPTDYHELHGIGAARIHDLALEPTNGTLFAATEDGLYTRSAGEWKLYGAGVLDLPVLSVAIAPSDSRLIYAGTSHRGVFVSQDGGNTWSAAGGDLGGRASIPGLVVDSRNPQNVFARVLYERIYKSSDGGDNWHTVWTGMPTSTEIETVAVDPNNPSIMYAGGDAQLYYSNDAGETWIGGELLGISTLALSIDARNSQKILAGTTDGLYVTADGGRKWERAGLANITISRLARDSSGVLYVGTKNKGLFVSRDDGQAVARLGSGLDQASVEALVVDDVRGIVFAATTSGIFCTPTGNSSATQSAESLCR